MNDPQSRKAQCWLGVTAVAIGAVVGWATAPEPATAATISKNVPAELDKWPGPESSADSRDNAAHEWAYRPIREYDVPDCDELADHPIHNPIDAFIAARLDEKGIDPAARADKRTLVRRACFDLTGLPPTPEQVERFMSDDSPDAFMRLVDRLLDSPAYGEQWGRHWLDVARYADTAGFSNDFERPNAWRYRDYVVRAFNNDKPYDEFVTEQIAGDELPEPTAEDLIATGFLRMGPWEHTGMSVEAITRQQYLDDVTHSVGVTFLAQGMECAKCHDHKFDPVKQTDFYRLQAVFAPVQFADRELTFQDWENDSGFGRPKQRYQRLLREAKQTRDRIQNKHRRAVDELLDEKGVESVEDLPEDERPERHFGLTTKEMGLSKIMRKRVFYYKRAIHRFEPWAFSVYNGPPRRYISNRDLHPMPPEKKREGDVQEIHVLKGGSLRAPGKKVAPGVLSAPQAFMPDDAGRIPEKKTGRRLALAEWLTHPDNPLTPRVIVNRVWQYHFGNKALVRTPNNFGGMGQRPTHPKLLDWLATWFMDNGWSFKKLHRLIMSSAAYQRSPRHSRMDAVRSAAPNNELLAYFPPRRLAAEEIRDAMLAVSDELNPAMGGPGFRPEINMRVAMQPRHIMGSVAPAYQPSPEREQRHRRTIYAFRRRGMNNPMLKVFNRPDSEQSCPRRAETTVSTQVFSLFNSGFAHDRALAFAHRLMQRAEDSETRLDLAFRLAYGRSPSEIERRQCRRHVETMLEHHKNRNPEKTELPTTVTREMIEELTGKPFTWDEKLDIYAGESGEYERDLKPWQVSPETRAWAELAIVLINSNEFLYVE